MDKTEYERLLKKEHDYQNKISNVVGVPFAVIAMPSWGLAFLGTFVFGPLTAALIAIPGAIALIIAIGAFVAMTRKSEKRESDLRARFAAENQN